MHVVLLILVVVLLAGQILTYRRVTQMATAAQINAAIDDLETSMGEEITEITKLVAAAQAKAPAATDDAADGVTAADLDEPLVRLGALSSALKSTTSSIRTTLGETSSDTASTGTSAEPATGEASTGSAETGTTAGV